PVSGDTAIRVSTKKFTPAASPPEAHRAVPDPAAPPASLPEALLRPRSAPPDTGPRRRPDSPSNQKCGQDKYETRRSPWVHGPSAKLVQSRCAPLPCPDSRWQLPPK